MTAIETAQNLPDESPTSDAAASGNLNDADETVAESSSNSESADESGESSTPGENPPSLSDVIANAIGALEDEPEAEAASETPAEEKAGSEEADADKPEAKVEPAKEETAEAAPKTEAHKGAQARIKELISEKKALQKQLEVVSELKRFTGDEAGFNNFRALVRNFAENPEAAVPMLETLLKDARIRAGFEVSEPDIQKKLEDGLLDDETASELQRLRVREQRRARELEQMQLERRAEAMAEAVNQWEQSVRQRNPDFERVAKRVLAEAKLLAYENPPNTPEEAVAIAKKAYEEVTGWLRSQLPEKAPIKVAKATGSTQKTVVRPKSIEDIMRKNFG